MPSQPLPCRAGSHDGSPWDSAASQDDPRLILALEEYISAIERGASPAKAEFLRTHADIAGRLAECLDGLDALNLARSDLTPPNAFGSGQDTLDHGTGLRSRDEPPLELGDFEIRREVGRGGMGVVYEALQKSLHRRVALKVLPFAATLDPRQLQRFKTEAMAAACLQHPHIVSVHSVGCERGVHYYAMQFIEGRSLLEMIALGRGKRRLQLLDDSELFPTTAVAPKPGEEGARPPGFERGPEPLEFREAADFKRVARLGIQAAEAIEHAHILGILHRDIKPANLMVDDRGHLWVTDFGLARIQAHASVSRSGDILGTLRYMSPEQALARRTVLDHRTDVYSLGATLYEAITLEPVFESQDNQELVRKVVNDPPKAPRRVDPRIPRDLETIVLKALAKDPEARYPSAQDMADDLRRFVEDRPIRARRPSPAERLSRWSRRHRPIVGAVAAVMVVALGVLSATTVMLADERIKAQEGEAKAVHAGRRLFAMADEMYEQIADEWVAVDPEKADLQKRFLAKALGIYEEFGREHAGDPAMRRERALAYRKVGDIHYRLGHHGESIVAYEKSLELLGKLGPAPAPTDERSINDAAHALHRLGELNSLEMRYDRAGDYFQRAVDIQEAWVRGSSLVGPRQDLAFYLRELGQFRASAANKSQAEWAFNRAIEISSGLAEQRRRQPSADRALLEEIDALQLTIRGRLLRMRGEFPRAAASHREAVELYEQLALRHPSRPDYLAGLIDSTIQFAWFLVKCPDLQVRDHDEAARLARDAVTLHPDNYNTHLQAAQILVEVGRFEEAERLLSQVVESSPDRADARNNLAWFLLTRSSVTERDAARAVSLAEEAIQQAPDLGIYWNTLGVAQFRVGNYRAAVASLEKSMALRDGGDSYDWFFLSMSQWKLGDHDVARRIYDEAIDWMDTYAKTNSDLVQFRLEAGTLMEARTASHSSDPAAASAQRIAQAPRAQGV